MENILTFMTENKEIVLGAAAVCSELIVIIVNLVRKLKKKEEAATQVVEAMGMVQAGQGIENLPTLGPPESSSDAFWWSVNPINLFKKP